MSRILDFDLGNSRLKWRWRSDGEPPRFGAIAYGPHDSPALPDSLREVDRIRIASVVRGPFFERLMQWCRLACEPEMARVIQHCAGVNQGYRDMSRLGVDRWLALLAAHDQHGVDSVVVSCGSAVTVDLLQADGQHKGGYIVPGIDMMRQALFAGTDAVKLERSVAPEDLSPGRDTATAVNAGLLAMVRSFVLFAANQLRAADGDPPLIVITGGAGEVLRRYIGQGSVYNPHLVLDGLALALP